MAPTIDIGVQSFVANNPSAPNGGYINGDIIYVQATIINLSLIHILTLPTTSTV